MSTESTESNNDAQHISAAQGWIVLRQHIEAAAHLDKVSPAGRTSLDYLSALWEVQNKTRKWDEAADTAVQMQKIAPDHISGHIWRSMSLEKLGRTVEAYENLEPVAHKFKDTGIVAYLLAAYACQLHWTAEAKRWLTSAFASSDGKDLKLRALEDKSLEPFWELIGEL